MNIEARLDRIEKELKYLNKLAAPALYAQGKVLCPDNHADTEFLSHYDSDSTDRYYCHICDESFFAARREAKVPVEY